MNYITVKIFISNNKNELGVRKVWVTNNKHEMGAIKGFAVNNKYDAQLKVYICKNKYE